MLAEGSFTDPENTRTIYLAAGALLAVAVGLSVATLVWWRRGATEHPALGPLEVMSTRQWRHADYATRQRELDEARPEHDGDDEHDPVIEPVDLEALVKASPPQFDDLADPLLAPALVAVPAEGAPVVPVEVPAEVLAPVEAVAPVPPTHDETAATDAPDEVEVAETEASLADGPADEPAAAAAAADGPSAADEPVADEPDEAEVEPEVAETPRPIDPLLRTNAAD